jgi:hypothetical protein
MRRILLLFAMALTPLVAATLTEEDRNFAIKELENSRRLLMESLKGVTAEQWKFKPAPDRWSIAECVEHLTLTEDALMQFVAEKLLKTEPIQRLGAINRQDDLEILKSAKDRSRKAIASESLRPTNQWPRRNLLLDEFRRRRERTVEYARGTSDDLRAHVEQVGPGRVRDGFQYLLIISGHTERHVVQIEEIKKNPQYPSDSYKKTRSRP